MSSRFNRLSNTLEQNNDTLEPKSDTLDKITTTDWALSVLN